MRNTRRSSAHGIGAQLAHNWCTMAAPSYSRLWRPSHGRESHYLFLDECDRRSQRRGNEVRRTALGQTEGKIRAGLYAVDGPPRKDCVCRARRHKDRVTAQLLFCCARGCREQEARLSRWIHTRPTFFPPPPYGRAACVTRPVNPSASRNASALRGWWRRRRRRRQGDEGPTDALSPPILCLLCLCRRGARRRPISFCAPRFSPTAQASERTRRCDSPSAVIIEKFESSRAGTLRDSSAPLLSIVISFRL
jgi:hypothetical protein